MPVDIRPLVAADADAATAILSEAFAAFSRQRGEPPPDITDERRAGTIRRIQRFTETDAPGCWAAAIDGVLAGYAIAIRREHLWGLAQLFVHPEHQSARLGSRLLERARNSAEGATIEMIQSSHDPRAIRRYASLGLTLHPAMGISGELDRSAIPVGLAVREGTRSDLDLVTDVDRRLREVPRTSDAVALMDDGVSLLVADGAARGFALHDRGSVVMLGADDEATARTLLWACLAEKDGAIEQWGWTGAQGWAIDVALVGRLEVTPGGPMFLRGLPTYPVHYLPSGIYF